MSKIKGVDTMPEVLLCKTLWNLGYRYRKNNRKIFGKPDISFRKYKIAVFIDGEIFHGYNWEEKNIRIKANRDYWIPKIERNIQRDKEVNEYLTSQGWTVLRFWSKEVKKNLDEVVKVIKNEINKNKK